MGTKLHLGLWLTFVYWTGWPEQITTRSSSYPRHLSFPRFTCSSWTELRPLLEMDHQQFAPLIHHLSTRWLAEVPLAQPRCVKSVIYSFHMLIHSQILSPKFATNIHKVIFFFINERRKTFKSLFPGKPYTSPNTRLLQISRLLFSLVNCKQLKCFS